MVSSENTDRVQINIIALRNQKMSKRRQKSRNGANLFILGLILTSLIVFVSNLASVQAKEYRSQLVATANTPWQAASFPVENFQAYTSPFGYRHSATGGSNWEFHSGLDIAAPQGSYVRNWWGGTVVKVSDRTNCGTQVTIQSGGWQHTYCHMEGNVESANGIRYMVDRGGGIQVGEGQQIPAGARIGRVGMTGRTTGPHLHWGLKYSGNYVDPAMVLRAMFSQQTATRQSKPQFTRQQTQIKIEESKFIRDAGY